MKLVAATTKQNDEDYVSYIMEGMLETGQWYRNLEGCYRESCHMCIDLNANEEGSYEVFHRDKQTKMSYKMVNIFIVLLIYHIWTL